MQTLLDTHAWLWWVTGDKRLSTKAATKISEAAKAQSLYISVISIWEIAKKIEQRQLVLDRNLDVWLDSAIKPQELQMIELTRTIMVESCRLPKPFHGDPADQLIVATARDRAATLISKDQKIRTYSHVESFW
jgi:PIN domain nuclease of toxin-antitoxin system